jgi:hypothetical protein
MIENADGHGILSGANLSRISVACKPICHPFTRDQRKWLLTLFPLAPSHAKSAAGNSSVDLVIFTKWLIQKRDRGL